MILQHEKLDDFEPTIKHLYDLTFFSENLNNIIFPNKTSYIISCYNDYNIGQNNIALSVFTLYDLKRQKQSEIKEYHLLNNNVICDDLRIQVKVIENRILVLRRLADSIAFRIFDNKIWIAKRFKSQHKINALDIPGIKTNLEVASKLNAEGNLHFALVSDITTFIDVGDLILKVDNGNPRWSIVELKTGNINQKLFQLIETNQHLNPEIITSFDNTTQQQLHRILRQKEKNKAIVDLIKNNNGKNLRTNSQVKLLDGNIQWKYSFEELKKSISCTKQNNHSLEVVDNCFFIFTSSMSEQDTFHYFYHIIYPDKKCTFKDGSDDLQLQEHLKCQKLLHNPYVKEITRSNMYAKWSTPFFAIPIKEYLLDILFQRIKVLLYLDIEKFIELLCSNGFKVETCSKEDTIFLRASAPLTPLYKDRAIKVHDQNGNSMIIGDGLFKRLFIDFVTPITLVNIINNTIQHIESENELV